MSPEGGGISGRNAALGPGSRTRAVGVELLHLFFGGMVRSDTYCKSIFSRVFNKMSLYYNAESFALLEGFAPHTIRSVDGR